MTTLDVVILLAALAGLISGFVSGLVRQVVAIAGFILALVLALELMPFLAERVVEPVGIDGTAARVTAFVGVFVIVQTLAFLLGRLVQKAVGALHLSFLNRLGGAAIGVAKGVLLMSVALVLLARVGIPEGQARRESVLYGPTVLLVPSVWDLAAQAWPRIQTVSEKFGEEVRSYWSEDAP
ncbi:MAG TPA: CvpA family protein [Rhodothermales bacterium]